jgi:hypothetical protein
MTPIERIEQEIRGCIFGDARTEIREESLYYAIRVIGRANISGLQTYYNMAFVDFTTQTASFILMKTDYDLYFEPEKIYPEAREL